MAGEAPGRRTIAVTEICPGFVETAMMKAARPFWAASPARAADDNRARHPAACPARLCHPAVGTGRRPAEARRHARRRRHAEEKGTTALTLPAIVQGYLAACNREDVAALVACAAEDVVFENVSNTGPGTTIPGR